MKANLSIISGALSIALLAGCASKPVILSPVGPEPENHAAAFKGYLQVYSDTETHVIGDGPPYYTHTGYSIYDRSGVREKYVPNHIGDMDESPMLVRVPVGTHFVVAESSAYGRVTIPVMIKASRKTVVHLDRNWRPALDARSNNLVRLPDGEAVGWAGATAKSSP